MHSNRSYWAAGAAPSPFTITGTVISDATLNSTATAATYCASGGGGAPCPTDVMAAFDLHTYATALNAMLTNSNPVTTVTCHAFGSGELHDSSDLERKGGIDQYPRRRQHHGIDVRSHLYAVRRALVIRTPHTPPRALPQRGFTLIEIMVALLIGLFLLGALLIIVQTNKRVFVNQNQLAQLQDGERMALTVISDVHPVGGLFS